MGNFTSRNSVIYSADVLAYRVPSTELGARKLMVGETEVVLTPRSSSAGAEQLSLGYLCRDIMKSSAKERF